MLGRPLGGDESLGCTCDACEFEEGFVFEPTCLLESKVYFEFSFKTKIYKIIISETPCFKNEQKLIEMLSKGLSKGFL